MLKDIFKRKGKGQLYFALVVSDRPTDGFKFESDKDCTMFLANGEVMPDVVIPRTVLKEIVDRFHKPSAQLSAGEEDQVRVSERKL